MGAIRTTGQAREIRHGIQLARRHMSAGDTLARLHKEHGMPSQVVVAIFREVCEEGVKGKPKLTLRTHTEVFARTNSKLQSASQSVREGSL
jgi:hypothetical protein